MSQKNDKWYSEETIFSSLSPNGQVTIKVGVAGTPISVLPFPIGGSKDRQRCRANTIVDAVKFFKRKEEIEEQLNRCIEYFKIHNENGQSRIITRSLKNLLNKI